MSPLPSVDCVCATIQQEEMQRQVLDEYKSTLFEVSALYNKGVEEKCGVCGNKGHQKEKCWQVIGYPSWHCRSKKFPQKKGTKHSKDQKAKDNLKIKLQQ